MKLETHWTEFFFFTFTWWFVFLPVYFVFLQFFTLTFLRFVFEFCFQYFLVSYYYISGQYWLSIASLFIANLKFVRILSNSSWKLQAVQDKMEKWTSIVSFFFNGYKFRTLNLISNNFIQRYKNEINKIITIFSSSILISVFMQIGTESFTFTMLKLMWISWTELEKNFRQIFWPSFWKLFDIRILRLCKFIDICKIS